LLVASTSPRRARVFDLIRHVVLDPTGPVFTTLEIVGAGAVWADEDSFYYITLHEAEVDTCLDSGRPEENVFRRRTISTGDDEVVDVRVFRAWRGGGVAPGPRSIAMSWDTASSCMSTNIVIHHLDPVTGEPAPQRWTTDWSFYYIIGLLPDASGYLVQKPDEWEGTTSRLYAASFNGDAVGLRAAMTAAHSGRLVTPDVTDVSLGQIPGLWADCGTVRRMGPACELYCRNAVTGAMERYALDGGDPEPVECPELGEDFRIMDVFQR
jgi:hypothetical protein